MKNKLKILMTDTRGEEFDLDYDVYDSELAQIWMRKIKHLRKIPIDPIESNKENLEDIENITKNFCLLAGIKHSPIVEINQHILNQLHNIYETHHDRLSKLKDNSLLYLFHHAIHYHEDKKSTLKRLEVGWGTNEGPLTQEFPCNNYYADGIKKNHIYLPWAELGKKPFTYWMNKEPTDQSRFMELCKPHVTFRAKFMIALRDVKIMPFPNQFNQWFNQFKSQWLSLHGLDKWDEVDEISAPLLAIPQHKFDISGSSFVRIL